MDLVARERIAAARERREGTAAVRARMERRLRELQRLGAGGRGAGRRAAAAAAAAALVAGGELYDAVEEELYGDDYEYDMGGEGGEGGEELGGEGEGEGAGVGVLRGQGQGGDGEDDDDEILSYSVGGGDEGEYGEEEEEGEAEGEEYGGRGVYGSGRRGAAAVVGVGAGEVAAWVGALDEKAETEEGDGGAEEGEQGERGQAATAVTGSQGDQQEFEEQPVLYGLGLDDDVLLYGEDGAVEYGSDSEDDDRIEELLAAMLADGEAEAGVEELEGQGAGLGVKKAAAAAVGQVDVPVQGAAAAAAGAAVPAATAAAARPAPPTAAEALAAARAGAVVLSRRQQQQQQQQQQRKQHGTGGDGGATGMPPWQSAAATASEEPGPSLGSPGEGRGASGDDGIGEAAAPLPPPLQLLPEQRDDLRALPSQPGAQQQQRQEQQQQEDNTAASAPNRVRGTRASGGGYVAPAPEGWQVVGWDGKQSRPQPQSKQKEQQDASGAAGAAAAVSRPPSPAPPARPPLRAFLYCLGQGEVYDALWRAEDELVERLVFVTRLRDADVVLHRWVNGGVGGCNMVG